MKSNAVGNLANGLHGFPTRANSDGKLTELENDSDYRGFIVFLPQNQSDNLFIQFSCIRFLHFSFFLGCLF
jgi:hypothetical protein